MFRHVKQLAVLMVVCQLVFPWAIFAAPVGEFIHVVGDVTLTRAGKAIKAAQKMSVQEKDLIVTAKGASAKLGFIDESTVTLYEKTNFEVRSFQMKDKTRKGSFFVSLGRLTADVKKFIGGGSTFEMQSPTATAGVRGTGFEFVVAMVGAQMSTTVTCTAGALSVSALSATGAVISTATIVAGQTAIITSTGITVSAAAVGTGAGAATTGTGTTVTTATGTGTVTTSTGAAASGATGAAAGAGAGAAGAGAAAGGLTVAGVGVGTVAAATVVTAAVVAAAVTSASSDNKTTPAVHTTPRHH